MGYEDRCRLGVGAKGSRLTLKETFRNYLGGWASARSCRAIAMGGGRPGEPLAFT